MARAGLAAARPATLRAITNLVSRELRETDMLAADATTVSLVLLDADVQNSARVIERVMARLEHYQFTTPVEIEVGAACCPTPASSPPGWHTPLPPG